VRRRAKRGLYAVLGVLAFVLVGYTAAFAYFNDAVLGDFISRAVNKVERGTFTLRHARYTWAGGLASILFGTRAHVVAEGYELRDPDGNLVLSVPYVETDAYLQPLIGSLLKMAVTHRFHLDLHFTNAWVPTGYGIIGPTRSTWGSAATEVNIVAAMSPKKKTPPDGGELRITVDALQLDDICFGIGFSNLEGGNAWNGRFCNGAGRASLVYSSRDALATPDGPYFFFKVLPLRAPSGELKMGDFHFPLEALTALEFGPNGDRRQDIVFRATTKTLGAEVRVEGALTDSYTTAGVRLTLDFEHGAGAMKLLPPPVSDWLAGDPDGQLRINGPFSNVKIEGDVRHAEAVLDGLALHDAAARLSLGNDSVLRFDPLTAKAAGGELGAALEVGLVERGWWRARLTLRGVDPAKVPQVPKEVAPSLTGRFDGRLQLGGSLVDHPERVRVSNIDGTLERTGRGKLPHLITLAGGVELAPERVSLDGLKIGASGAQLSATGSVDPATGKLDARVRVDADRASQALHAFGLPSALTVDALHGEGSLGGRWPRPHLTLHVNATDVGWLGRALDHLQADVSFNDGVVQLDQVSGRGLGGEVAGWAHFGLFAGDVTHPLRQPTLRAQIDAGGLSLAGLGGAPVVDGVADVHFALDGPLEHPHGRGLVELPRLTIYGDKYHRGRLAFELDDNGASAKEIFLAREGGGELRGSGKLDWSGSYALQLAPKDLPIQAVPNVSSLPFSLGGTLSGELEFEGERDRWMVGGVAKLAGFKLRDALIGDGQLTLDPGGDASHVTGRAFKHFAIDGTLTSSPRFAFNVTIRFDDVSLESLFPEMQQLADVTGRTSGSANVKFNFETGLSATVQLDQLELTLSGTDEDTGHLRHLVVRNRDPVRIASNGDGIVLSRTQLTSALGDFYIEAPAITPQKLDARMRGQIGLELLEYFFKGWFDHTDGNAYVDLTVKGDAQTPRLNGQIDLRKVTLIPHGLDQQRLKVTSGHVEFTESAATLSNFYFRMDDGAIARASGSVQLDGWKPGAISGQIDGEVSARILQLPLIGGEQVVDASGRIAVNVHLEGQWSRPRWQGTARVTPGGVSLQLRRFDHQLQIASGTLSFIGYDLTLGCPRTGARPPGCEPIVGTIDGTSPAELEGVIGFGEDLSLRRIDVYGTGNEIRQTTHQFTLLISPRVHLSSLDGSHLELSGTVQLVEGRYTQEFDVKDFVIKPRAVEVEEPFWSGNPRLETLTLALHAQATGPLYVKIKGVADLTISSATVDISNTLSEPRLSGTLLIDEGGAVTLPLVRVPLTSDQGRITFDAEKRIPDETPTVDLTASGVCTDRLDNQHPIQLVFAGTLKDPKVTPRSLEGWDQSAIGFCLLSGKTQEDVRRLTQGGDTSAAGRGASATEGIAKTVSGAAINEVISDPVKRVFGLDTTSIELGGQSVDVKLCKNFGRFIKACGQGELAFVGGSRLQGFVQLRLSDYFSALGRAEYLSQGIDTLQDTTTRLKLELNYRIPLGY
jgi:hypothetical protein